MADLLPFVVIVVYAGGGWVNIVHWVCKTTSDIVRLLLLILEIEAALHCGLIVHLFKSIIFFNWAIWNRSISRFPTLGERWLCDITRTWIRRPIMSSIYIFNTEEDSISLSFPAILAQCLLVQTPLTGTPILVRKHAIATCTPALLLRIVFPRQKIPITSVILSLSTMMSHQWTPLDALKHHWVLRLSTRLSHVYLIYQKSTLCESVSAKSCFSITTKIK